MVTRREFIGYCLIGILGLATHSLTKENNKVKIPILVYHSFNDNKKYSRNLKRFENDLFMFYNKGFKLATIDDILDRPLIAFKNKVIILTFDDAWPSQLSFYKSYQLKNCGVKVLEDFCREHEDFVIGHKAIFFISFDKGGIFDKKDSISEQDKLKWLIDNGYIIGNHTYNHIRLDLVSPEEGIKDIEIAQKRLEKIVNSIRGIAYPYGKPPREEIMDYIKQNFDYSVKASTGNKVWLVTLQNIKAYNIGRKSVLNKERLKLTSIKNY